MAVATLRHAFSRDIRVLVISLQYSGQGAGIASELVPQVAAEFGKEQNKDWAFLGFQPNAVVAMMQMGEASGALPGRLLRHPIEKIPCWEGCRTTARSPPWSAWPQARSRVLGHLPGSRYGLTSSTGLTPSTWPTSSPSTRRGQIRGILEDSRERRSTRSCWAAWATHAPGCARKGGALRMIIFIVLGNAAYLWSRREDSVDGRQRHPLDLPGRFMTLACFSFLYRDNPLYKLAEHLSVASPSASWS